jgi:histidine triad (HIT) family protein
VDEDIATYNTAKEDALGGVLEESNPAPCTFCAIAERSVQASFVYEDEDVLAFLDIHPVNTGHVLVIPKQHFTSLSKVPEPIGARLFTIAQRLAEAIRRSGVRCEGILLTLADGPAAGQEVLHCHVHIVPRFAGDKYQVSAEWSTPVRQDQDAVATQIRAALLRTT